MSVIVSNNLSKISEGKYIFLDNDFLGKISEDVDLFNKTISLFSDGYLSVDPYVIIEFLRDIFVPKILAGKEKFIFNDKIFIPIISHQMIFNKLQQNALLLSKIYKHQQQGARSKCSSSFVDLFLAARIMLYSENSILVTGNKKDFPSSVFDLLGIISNEEGDGSIRSFCILSFNKAKFEKCYEALKSVDKKDKIIHSKSSDIK